eukprot:m.309331 g.309331  ORF g.309331 m.309331 type:complete len:452 (+) comp46084_c0_seq1:59-1414(+)
MAFLAILRRSSKPLYIATSIRWINFVRSIRPFSSLSSSLRSFARPSPPRHVVQLGLRRFRASPSLAANGDVLTVETPPFAESITEGDIRWEKGVGDSVAEDEQVGEIETDKTTIPLNSPASGVVLELLVEDGATVTPGTKLLRLQSGGKSEPKAVKAASDIPAAAEVPAPPVPKNDVKTPLPDSLPPAPPLPSGPMAVVTPTPVPTAAASSSGSYSGVSRGEKRVKMSRMRNRIAERLKSAQNTCAMLTTFNEVDMGNVIDMRSQHKEAFLKKHGVKLGFMSAFVKATTFALQDQPVVNAVIEGNEIVYRDYVDISVAISAPKGLVVPVLRNCEAMNCADIEKAIVDLGVKARDGTLAVEDMEGGTFTISNGGVFGSLYGTPIINPPQSAILGMHSIVDRPVAVKGQVVIRPMMYLALTYDHRLIDGREAVTFLRKVKSAVEDPRVILLDV